ncbi:hypothetical protein [Galbibacter sp. BG1]
MAAATGALIGAGLGAAQTIGGMIGKNKAKDAINNYERQDLNNAYDKLTVSTKGSDLAKEETQLANSTVIDALSTAGTRALLGGVGKVTQNTNNLNRQIGAGLDEQQKKIDYAVASDDARIRQMQERREESDLAGLGQEYDYQRNQFMQGIGALGQGAISAANVWGMEREDMQDSIGSTAALGLNPSGLINPLTGLAY